VRIAKGPLAGFLFSGGDTAGYVLGASEPAVQEQMLDHLAPGSVFYDVGANYGFFSLLGSRLVGDSGMVIAFEPLEENREKLADHLTINGRSNCRVLPLALSDECGTVELVLDHGTGRAGISFIERQGAVTRTVNSATLDSLTNLPAPDLVKIDVEGAEAYVLRGMRRVLQEHRPIVVVEIHGEQEGPVREFLAEVEYKARILDDDGGMRHLLAVAA
jgi:FkbM family methyltransferase